MMTINIITKEGYEDKAKQFKTYLYVVISTAIDVNHKLGINCTNIDKAFSFNITNDGNNVPIQINCRYNFRVITEEIVEFDENDTWIHRHTESFVKKLDAIHEIYFYFQLKTFSMSGMHEYLPIIRDDYEISALDDRINTLKDKGYIRTEEGYYAFYDEKAFYISMLMELNKSLEESEKYSIKNKTIKVIAKKYRKKLKKLISESLE